MVRKTIIILTFATGLAIFSYPLISHWLKTKEHYSIISEHNEVIAQMSEEERRNERDKAKEYNDQLSESSILIEDPFAMSEEESPQTGYYNILNIGETIGHLEIPKIDIKLPIYHGISDDVLQQGVGHMSNSSFPIGGNGSHTALTAHRGLPSTKLFRDLDKIKEDDLIYIKTLGETLAYQVDDIQIVLPSETSWLSIEEDEDYVTLITCEPYMINTHRLLVRGHRVPYEEEFREVASLGPSEEAATHGQVSIGEPFADKELRKQMVLIFSLLFVMVISLKYYLKLKKQRVKSDSK